MFIQTIRKTGAFNVKNLGADNSPNNNTALHNISAGRIDGNVGKGGCLTVGQPF